MVVYWPNFVLFNNLLYLNLLKLLNQVFYINKIKQNKTFDLFKS
jgi:hypothetical protein